MSASLIASIIIVLFLILFLVIGFHRGFLRIILTTFSLVITLVAAGALAQPLADYVENNTVIGPRVESKIETYINTQLESVTGTVTNAENSFIESLPLTNSMKDDLKAGNTLSNYVDQGVTGFAQYMAVSLTSIVLKILSYVLLFIVIFLLIRLILKLSDVINHIPLLGGVNRVAGAIFGLAEGVLFLWVICLIIMMMSGTEFGITCEKVINDSKFLTFIYENNYLMTIVNSIIGIFK